VIDIRSIRCGSVFGEGAAGLYGILCWVTPASSTGMHNLADTGILKNVTGNAKLR